MENGTLNNLSSAIGEYLSLRTDYFKKRIISGLSLGFSRVLSVLVMMMFLTVVLAVLAFAFTMLLSEAIGTLSGAAFIVGGAYLLFFLVLLLLRKRLFLNMFTNLFTELAETDTSPSGDWKSLVLTVIRSLRKG